MSGWKRGGQDIKFGYSKLNGIMEKAYLAKHENNPEAAEMYRSIRKPRFFQMSFTHDFNK